MVWSKYCEAVLEKGPHAFSKNWFSWYLAALGTCNQLAAYIENLTVQSRYDGSTWKGQWCCAFWSFCGVTGVTAGVLSPVFLPWLSCHAALIFHITVCWLPIFHTWVPLHPWCCSEWLHQCKQQKGSVSFVCQMFGSVAITLLSWHYFSCVHLTLMHSY